MRISDWSSDVCSSDLIEQLQTRHPGQDITASGDWTQVGGASRSRFALEFRGDDIGKMLDALGFSGMIDGGKVKVLMAGSWPGSPADFDMRVLNGSLDIDVGAGRILDVEPGAGRMMGLSSSQEGGGGTEGVR